MLQTRNVNLMPDKTQSETSGAVIISGDGTTVAIIYGRSYDSDEGEGWKVHGIAVAPVSAGSIDSSDLVVSINVPWDDYDHTGFRPGEMTRDGRLLTYYECHLDGDPSGLQTQGAVVDTRVRTTQHIGPDEQQYVGLSDDGRVPGWTQQCRDWGLPCPPEPEPHTRPMVQRMG